MIERKMIDIYYIEEDRDIAWSVQAYLSQRGCQVSIFRTAAEAKEALTRRCPGLVLVDWNLSDGDGNLLCRWIRERWRELPVIFLTVRGDSRDIVSGFQNGADDYVVKPFELEVLYSRILALLRRTGDVSGQYLSCDDISLDQIRMQVCCGQEEISLSALEYELLLCLLRQKGRTVTRGQLLERIWDRNGSYVNDNTLTVTMKRLREKLHQPACLKTIRSIGYRMEDTK